MSRRLVSGEIRLARQEKLPDGATAYVRLLNTSFADAPAQVVAEQVLHNVNRITNRGESIPFSLDGELQGAQDEYVINVLVDLNGDGQISVGDFINMQSYPVFTAGNPSHVVVEVKQVK